MIQRLQTIWLLFASALAFLTLKFSFYSGTFKPDNQYHQLNGTENILLMIVTIALALLAFINIFLFKNRTTQLRITIAAIVTDIILVILYFREMRNFSQGTYDLWSIFHLFIVAFLILAARGIMQDEKLIRDSDRLR